jgi:hypothetical protein
MEELKMINKLLNNDVINKEFVDMKQVADILCLKYHTARKLVLGNPDISFIDYGKKKLYLLDDVQEFKCKHFVNRTINQ